MLDFVHIKEDAVANMKIVKMLFWILFFLLVGIGLYTMIPDMLISNNGHVIVIAIIMMACASLGVVGYFQTICWLIGIRK